MSKVDTHGGGQYVNHNSKGYSPKHNKPPQQNNIKNAVSNNLTNKNNKNSFISTKPLNVPNRNVKSGRTVEQLVPDVKNISDRVTGPVSDTVNVRSDRKQVSVSDPSTHGRTKVLVSDSSATSGRVGQLVPEDLLSDRTLKSVPVTKENVSDRADVLGSEKVNKKQKELLIFAGKVGG